MRREPLMQVPRRASQIRPTATKRNVTVRTNQVLGSIFYAERSEGLAISINERLARGVATQVAHHQKARESITKLHQSTRIPRRHRAAEQ
jgi:hypothetical protein